MTYTEAVRYVNKLTKFGINLGLKRIRLLLSLVGNPHYYLQFIHIGGTNGKGSTAVMVASILQAAGYRVGLFTSPHLSDYTERISINGEKILHEEFAEIVSRLKPLLDNIAREGNEHPTEFEVNTALAFLYFYENNVDFVVLEVGLGGRVDSTNVVTPLISVITNVGMDHMNYLGNTLKEIAREKAGIIKRGKKVITASCDAEVLKVLQEECRRKYTDLIQVGRDITWKVVKRGTWGQIADILGIKRYYRKLYIPLLGAHQVINAATAVGSIELLEKEGAVTTCEDDIRKGLERVRWPGRFEVISREPYIIIDAAHNFDGALCLRRSLQELFKQRKIVFLIGMLADKERNKVAELLFPLVSAVIVTRPRSTRAGNWRYLAEEFRKYTPNVYSLENPSEALLKALEIASKEEVICITGSFYMIGEMREELLRMFRKFKF